MATWRVGSRPNKNTFALPRPAGSSGNNEKITKKSIDSQEEK